MIRLEKGFELPSPDDFDDYIAGMDQEIAEEGGASSYMGMIRSERISWESMENGVLRPLVRQAFRYEDAGYNGAAPRTDLAISKAALSGMLFGHLINESAYPRMADVRPYNTITPININLAPDFGDFEAIWETDQPRAYRLGVQAMSTLFIDSLSSESLEILSHWGETMVGSDRTTHFNFGFGTALYLAWDAYSDMIIAQGDVNRVDQYIATNLTRK